jgi:3'-phosphoadenosine 5'-phosphosulfate sulfotransferase (PAPS reductase)/FAD synthetase
VYFLGLSRRPVFLKKAKNMKQFISFSGGVESTAMCLLYGKGATAIFADTGAEHRKMYERLNYVEKMLKVYHDGDFELVRIKGSVDAKGEVVNSLTDYILRMCYFPSPRQRFCTRMFKIEPIDNYLSQFDECKLMIGLNADEADIRTGNYLKGKNITYRYPLIEDGHDRDHCYELLKQYGLQPDFPAYMNRGGCKYCPYKAKKEYRAMVHFSLDEIEEVATIEETIQDKRNKFFRIRSNMPKMRDFILIEKNNLFGDNSGYYSQPESFQSCGVFCHR